MNFSRLLVAVALVIASPSPARADSEGYFCFGKGYLAYELGYVSSAPHRLMVIRFDETGIGSPRRIELPPFQAQALDCGDSTVRLVSFDSMYSVSISPPGGPKLFRTHALIIRGRVPADFPPVANLAGLNRAARSFQLERIEIGRSSNSHTFRLEITPQTGSPPCVTNVESTLYEIDSGGRIVARRSIFRGEAYRDCPLPAVELIR